MKWHEWGCKLSANYPYGWFNLSAYKELELCLSITHNTRSLVYGENVTYVLARERYTYLEYPRWNPPLRWQAVGSGISRVTSVRAPRPSVCVRTDGCPWRGCSVEVCTVPPWATSAVKRLQYPSGPSIWSFHICARFRESQHDYGNIHTERLNLWK